MLLLEVSDVSQRKGTEWSLEPASFRQYKGQRIAIAGETGSGKTTLLKIIGGLEQPDSGHVFFEGQRVLGPFEKLIPGHPGIVYLSQYFELRNHYRVEEELESKNLLSDAEAASLYRVCRISHLLRRWTNELSGGEKQRIALARLLGTKPRLVLLDEPFSNLDPIHKKVMKAVINDLGTQLDVSCILVSHDVSDMLSWADNILVMQAGRIIQQADPPTIYRQSVNEYCAALFGEHHLLDATALEAIGISGIAMPPGKRLLVRPENIRLAEPTNAGDINARVTSRQFWGSYFTYDLMLAGMALRVRSAEPLFQPGDEVRATLVIETLCWL